MYHGTVDIGSRQISRYSVATEVAWYYQHMIWRNVSLMLVSFFLNQTLKIHSRTKISYSSFLAKDKHKFSWVNSSATYSTLKMDIILSHIFLSGSGSTFVHGAFECSWGWTEVWDCQQWRCHHETQVEKTRSDQQDLGSSTMGYQETSYKGMDCPLLDKV